MSRSYIQNKLLYLEVLGNNGMSPKKHKDYRDLYTPMCLPIIGMPYFISDVK